MDDGYTRATSSLSYDFDVQPTPINFEDIREKLTSFIVSQIIDEKDKILLCRYTTMMKCLVYICSFDLFYS
jgi:hypothetical protein